MLFKTSPPHLYAKGSVPQTFWTVLLALFPAAGVSLISSRGQTFRILVMTLMGSVLAEIGMRRLFKKAPTLYDGSAVASAFLLALILPPTLPSWMAVLGSVFMVAIGREAFGGLGQNLFNPVLVGNAFLLSLFPLTMNSFSSPLDIPLALASLAGGLLLIFARVIPWDTPLLYLVSVFLFSVLLGGEGAGALARGPVFLAAFFMVTDPATSPLTRWGKRGFSLGAGFFTAAFREWAGPLEGITYGLLLMNAFNPWLDHWIRPARAKKVLLS